MRKRVLVSVVAGAAGLAIFLAADSAGAATPPSVRSVIEGSNQLVVLGDKLTKAKAGLLRGAAGDVTLTLVLRVKNVLVFDVPAGTPEGDYQLVVELTKGAPLERSVTLTGGNARISPALRGDLDDAATLGGEPAAAFHDASKLTGTVDPARFSAHADLVAEGKIGPASGQVATGDHVHDERYFTETELSAGGTVNASSNPVDWNKLKSVPAGLADGVDDTVTFAGTGSATTAARSDHDHDARYFTQATLQSPGTINTTGNPVDWTKLKSVPTGFADGTDDTNWTLSGGDVFRATGRVGIGNSAPAAGLHVTSAEGVLFDGASGGSALSVSGSGRRLIWYPSKAAFRAGRVGGVRWDDANIGDNSVATGVDTLASGAESTALGGRTTASGVGSTAIGSDSTASGLSSTAIGSFTIASGAYATAFGRASLASGDYSVSMGENTTAQAYGSLVLGRFNVVAGTTTSWVATEPVLVVGNGTSSAAASNALTLLKNGNMTIAGTLTQNSDERLKESVEEISGVLARLKDVRGVSYRFKSDVSGPQGRQLGLVAQEVERAFPELVRKDANGTLSVAYGNFAAVLLEAVKEQQREIEKQQDEIAAQREELKRRDAEHARLAAAVAALEKRLDAADGR